MWDLSTELWHWEAKIHNQRSLSENKGNFKHKKSKSSNLFWQYFEFKFLAYRFFICFGICLEIIFPGIFIKLFPISFALWLILPTQWKLTRKKLNLIKLHDQTENKVHNASDNLIVYIFVYKVHKEDQISENISMEDIWALSKSLPMCLCIHLLRHHSTYTQLQGWQTSSNTLHTIITKQTIIFLFD